jgi:hypothetical protein
MMPTATKPTRILIVAACLALSACASGGPSDTVPRRGSSDRITADELQQSAGQDLYTVVQRLRPQWLVIRGGVTAQGRATIAVILDGVRQLGSVEVLRSMKAADTQELRFVNARDATTRYGTDMTAGAIEVLTKR